MSCCPTVLTPQEEWLQGKNLITEGRDRTLKLNDLIRHEPITMDINRARLFTEGMKKYEGEPLSVRWAKSFQHVLENLPIYVEPNYELIVGKLTGRIGRFITLYPENDGPALLELRGSDKRPVSPFYVAPEDLEIVENEIYPYWKDKSFSKAYAKAMPEETRRLIFGDDKENYTKQMAILSQSATARSSLNFNFDVVMLLEIGFKGYQDLASEKLAEVQQDPARLVKEGPFWEAALISAKACTTFIRRYADEARRVAMTVKDEKRRKELIQIAENCDWIAENPARDFRTALQLQWFQQILVRLDQNVGGALGNSRMDQHLWPYYEQDVKNGTLTRAEAKELFECYWLNLSQTIRGIVSESTAKFFEAYAHFETVTIGGQTPDGDDATNELSYIILESKHGFPTPYPDLAARIHSGTPDKFLHACAEVIKEGQGFPKLFNDEEIVPLYVQKGATMAEALDYAVSGCTETRVVSKETYNTGCAAINLGAVIELTMNNGHLKRFGDKLITIETGDPRTFKTYDEFFAAYKAQNEYIIRNAFIQQIVADKIKPQILAAPLSSLFIKPCREAAVDVNDHVPNSIEEHFIDNVGFATLIDSLTAIKKLVYEDKIITMDELCNALDANFEGYEVLQQMLINAPKFGNNDPYADEVGRSVDKVTSDYLATHRGANGEFFSYRIVPVTSHIPGGKVVGATPDGRKAGEYLSEGVSASHGAEGNGPTAVLISNKRIKHEGNMERAARLLNIKLSPSTLAGEEGTRRLMALIRTWCDLKLWHVQFNVINKETLIEAKEEPDNYRDLIVRVAGYSAYFVDMSPTLQDELIERAELAV